MQATAEPSLCDVTAFDHAVIDTILHVKDDKIQSLKEKIAKLECGRKGRVAKEKREEKKVESAEDNKSEGNFVDENVIEKDEEGINWKSEKIRRNWRKRRLMRRTRGEKQEDDELEERKGEEGKGEEEEVEEDEEKMMDVQVKSTSSYPSLMVVDKQIGEYVLVKMSTIAGSVQARTDRVRKKKKKLNFVTPPSTTLSK